MKTLIFILACAGLSAVAGAGGSKAPGPDRGGPLPVPSVDLQRYAGLWYEIAKIPNRFQRKCDRGTTATYALRGDGLISVINWCTTVEGEVIEASGVARVADAESNARLEVSFVRFLGFQLFWGDYWIIGLDPEYRFAVVGHPDRRYGWVLARERTLTPGQWERVHEILRGQGYDPDDFEMTRHEPGGGNY